MKKLSFLAVILAVSILGLAVSLPLDAQEPAGSDREGLALAQQMHRYLNFAGFDDPKTSLEEAIDSLQKRHDVIIRVNEKAFAADKVEDVLRYEIAHPHAIPPVPKATLAMVLNTVLNRIPAESGAMFVIRDGFLEFTTRKAMREELGRKAGEPLPPLVYIRFDNLPLEKALEQLSQRTGITLVLDVRAGDKGKTPVSGLFKSVPLDTVVRVLTDMAGLKPARIDNMIYITTAENAREMAKH